jgi:hypothetical protein
MEDFNEITKKHICQNSQEELFWEYWYDDCNNLIYYEFKSSKTGSYWRKNKYNSSNKLVHYYDSNMISVIRSYDKQGNLIYAENSDGFWSKMRYNKEKELIYLETKRNGVVIDDIQS